MGYRYIAILQAALTLILLLSLPLWKEQQAQEEEGAASFLSPLSLGQIFLLPGAKAAMTAFFCYCALEATAGLWAASYLVLHHGAEAKAAAGFASLFYMGITAGRAVNGFLSLKLSDTQMVRLGQGIILFGALLLLLSFSQAVSLAGLVMIGLGCAPIYPSMLHATPHHFGAGRSQAIMGVQMACAYVGTCLMPPLFGLIASHVSIVLFPVFLLLILVLMVFTHEKLINMEDIG